MQSIKSIAAYVISLLDELTKLVKEICKCSEE